MAPDKTHRKTPDTPIPVWEPSLSVRNAKLDEQHITLLALGTYLIILIETHPSSNEQIRVVLKDIVSLSREHDAIEEDVLEENGCPSLAEHKMAHETARPELNDLLHDASHNFVDKAVLTRVITEWRSNHISEYDLPVKEYMKMKPPVASPSAVDGPGTDNTPQHS